jgi:uncharacterized delta-60 repeat protein
LHSLARNSRRPTVEQLEDRNLLSAGFLDSAFGNAGVATAHFAGFDSSSAVGAVVQPDGKIVVAGVAGSATYAVARFNPTGTLDNTFGTGGEVTTQMSGVPVGIVLQPDGKILVGGTSLLGFGISSLGFGLARYNADGSLDTGFGTGGIFTIQITRYGDYVTSILLQPDGKIVMVGGLRFSSDLPYMTELLRLNPNGSIDAGFGNSGFTAFSGRGGTAALQPDGQIVVPDPRNPAPTSSSVDTAWFLDRVNQDGSGDTSFTPSIDFGRGPNRNIAVAIQADGRLITTGFAGQPALARLNPDGTLDTSFGISGKLLTPLSGSLAIQSDGRILITSTANGSSGLGGLMRYLPDGSVDTVFGIDGSASPFPSGLGSGITLQSDGSILVMGSVPAAPGTGADLAVARYLGGPSAALTGTVNQRFVQQLYLDLLGRPGESGGLTFWSGLLDGGQATRIQVVQGIQQSAEYRSLVVGSLYNLYFHRPVDATGLAAWTSFLASGGTTDQLRAQLLGSDEYARAHPGGNTAPSFLEGLYHDVLYRTMDPAGETAWTQALNNGASNAAVALAIIQSQEGASDEVQGLYHRLLHRPPDATGLTQFGSALKQGTSNDLILALIAGSDEYVARL